MSLRSWRARAARAGLHAPVARLRHFGLDANDVFLVSHGRSGNTLLRFVLAEILSGVPSTFDTIQRVVPEVGLQHNAQPILPGGGRLIKTHEPYTRVYKRAIYIVRDVRDVLLSHFARETAVGSIHGDYRELDDYIVPFLTGKISHWGSWQAHVEGWINSPPARRGDLLFLRFEDMRKDLEGSVVRCLEYLGANYDMGVVQGAICNNSLERMRAKEDEAKSFPKVRGEQGRQVGEGAVAGWRNKLTQRQLEIIDELAGDVLARCGYPTGISSSNETGGGKAQARQSSPEDSKRAPHLAGLTSRSRVNLRGETAAAHGLRVRLGGRIASIFSWYSY